MKIKKCRSCDSKNLLKIISLGKQYLSDFVTTNKKPKAFPLSIVLCKNCKLLQLDYNAPAKYLYTERYGYKSGINQTMKDELKEIAQEALKKVKKTKNKVIAVDIGTNDGTLLKYYPKKIYRIGVEPIKKLAKEAKKNANLIVNNFFTFEAVSKEKKNLKADIVSAISCFYDMEQPNKFVEDVAKILKPDGVFVIQQNYVVEMLAQNAFDNIVHEHLEYYSLLSLSNLLKRHNLEVFDVELRTLNGGSFRTYISFKGTRRITKAVKKMEIKERRLGLDKKTTYLKFAKRLILNKKKLLKFINKKIKENKTIYLYGASTRGNTLLQFYELGKKHIIFAVERNPEKWGKKIASVGISIISEEQARKNKPDFMLVLPWFFKKEFVKREKAYIKHGGHLIFPLPKLEVI